jgi:hypothetical protein
MQSEEDLAERLVERLPMEEAEECLRRLEERLITVDVLGIADAQDLADECGFTERQCEAVLLDDVTWRAKYGKEHAGAPGVRGNADVAIQHHRGEATPKGSSSVYLAARLRDISAWLVLNAMRTERVQFDQLCTQNICNVWRSNAWGQLLAGHAHFKVRPEEAGSFLLDLLGEAFVSAKGNVSRATALEDKYVAILLGSFRSLTSVMDAVKSATSNFGNELAVVWVSDGDDENLFNNTLQVVPILAIPHSHKQRLRKILSFFGHMSGEGLPAKLILVDRDGRMITRQGKLLFEMAEMSRKIYEMGDDESAYARERKDLTHYQKIVRRERIALDVAQVSICKARCAKVAGQTGVDGSGLACWRLRAPGWEGACRSVARVYVCVSAVCPWTLLLT